MREGFSDRWGRQFRSWVEAAGQKTEEIARVSKRQVELLQVDWDLLRRRSDLGERVLRLIDGGDFPGWSRDPHLVDLVEEVRSLEKEQQRVRREIDAIRRGASPDPDEFEDDEEARGGR